MISFKPEVWMHKKTGQLYEHFSSVLGPALTMVDTETPAKGHEFTNWHDWGRRKLFSFDDGELYNKELFENLGEL